MASGRFDAAASDLDMNPRPRALRHAGACLFRVGRGRLPSAKARTARTATTLGARTMSAE